MMILIVFFIYPPLLFKLMDISQLFGLLLFLDTPDLYKQKSYLSDLRLDNWLPLIPNHVLRSSSSSYEIEKMKMIHIDGQLSSFPYHSVGYSSSALVNIYPLLLLYGCTFAVLAALTFIKSKNLLHEKLRVNFKWNIVIMVFLVTFSEEVVIIVLQFKNAAFNNAFNSMGAVLATLLLAHVAGMLLIIYRKTSQYCKEDESTQVLQIFSASTKIRMNRYQVLFQCSIKFLTTVMVLALEQCRAASVFVLVGICLYGAHDLVQNRVAFK